MVVCGRYIHKLWLGPTFTPMFSKQFSEWAEIRPFASSHWLSWRVLPSHLIGHPQCRTPPAFIPYINAPHLSINQSINQSTHPSIQPLYPSIHVILTIRLSVGLPVDRSESQCLRSKTSRRTRGSMPAQDVYAHIFPEQNESPEGPKQLLSRIVNCRFNIDAYCFHVATSLP